MVEGGADMEVDTTEEVKAVKVELAVKMKMTVKLLGMAAEQMEIDVDLIQMAVDKNDD